MKKVKIVSHWICDGEDKHGKIGEWDTAWLDSIGVLYEIQAKDK